MIQLQVPLTPEQQLEEISKCLAGYRHLLRINPDDKALVVGKERVEKFKVELEKETGK